MSELKPTILAKDIEEFTEISKLLETLPNEIFSQIEKAQNNLIGIKCNLRYNYKNEQNIYLPNYTTQITDFGDYIGIYSGKFFFTIEGDFKKIKISYIFIDSNTIEK